MQRSALVKVYAGAVLIAALEVIAIVLAGSVAL